MGRPKAWLDVRGRPALQRIVDIARAACPTVVVAAAPGQELPELPEGVIRVDDPADRAHQGPLSGIATGLGALAEEQVDLAYIGACDTIFLTIEHVWAMLDALARDRQHAAVVPESGPFDDGTRILHALCGAVRVPVARQTAAALLQAGNRAARSLYEGLAARRLSVARLPEPRVVRTCNTPQEWADAVAELSGDT